MMSNDERTLDTIVSAGWANESDGHVDSPTGHFALVDLTTDTEVIADEILEDDDDMPAPAWYVLITDTIGNRFVRPFYLESSAREAYDALAAEYAEWLDDDDDDDDDDDGGGVITFAPGEVYLDSEAGVFHRYDGTCHDSH